MLDRLCDALAALGLHTLVVDAADSAPAPHEMALIDLAACIEPLSGDVSYLAARGLPTAPCRHARLAAPRFSKRWNALRRRPTWCWCMPAPWTWRACSPSQRLRPLLLAADTPASVTQAYAAMKLLAQRPGWLAFDLLIVADPNGRRAPSGCASSLAELRRAFSRRSDPRLRGDRSGRRRGRRARPALIHLLRAQMAQDLLQDSTLMPLAHHAPALH